MCDTHIFDGAVLSSKVNMHFTSIYLVTGCWHGAPGKEASSEQGVSIGMSEVRTAKPDPSSRKAESSDMCGSLSRDLLPLPEHDGMCREEGLYICGADLFQHQKEIRDKLCRRAEGQPSFLTNSSVHTGEMGPAVEMGSPSWAAQAFYSSWPLVVWGSHMGTLSARRPFVMNRVITGAFGVGKPSAENRYLVSTRKSRLEYSLMSIANAGNASSTKPTL